MKKYDMHIHTMYSRCAVNKPEDILRIAKKRGLNGIAVTDHNTIKGGKETKKLNKDRNFEVIVGAEIKLTNGGEILGYYLNKEIKSREPKEVINEIHSQGGLAFVSHPFTQGLYRKPMKVEWEEISKIDGFETFNARMIFRWENELAVQVAQKKKLAQVGGSDAHFNREIGRAFTVFEGDFRKAIKNKKTIVAGRIAPIPFYRLLSVANRWLFKSNIRK